MNINYEYLFQYIEKENISFDKAEFLFQLQSHPDYPSLLATADTLSFFSIPNGVMRVQIKDSYLLPNSFVASLIEDNYSDFHYIEKKDNYFYYYNKNKKKNKLNSEELEYRWNDIVLLIEKPEIVIHPNVKKNLGVKICASIFLILFIFIIHQLEGKWQDKYFFLFPSIGILFSLAAVKDLFGTRLEFTNNFCNITKQISCSTVIESQKWKIFNYINLSDLSIIFFSSQFINLFIFLLSSNSMVYFNIQKILLTISIPILLTSIYYQKKVEKKWCPICLTIIGIVILESFYVNYYYDFTTNLLIMQILIFISTSMGIALFWFPLKKILQSQKKLKEFYFSGNRFMRNYDIFKTVLISKDRIESPEVPIVLGNVNSNIEILLITSPFCGHCERVHEIINNILSKNRDFLNVKILIRADLNNLDNEKKMFLRILFSIYLSEGDILFLKALNEWFKSKNLKDWMHKYKLTTDNENLDLIYNKHSRWCMQNDLNFTPGIFINGYQYPKTYDRENLEFFVNELIDDNTFNKEINLV